MTESKTKIGDQCHTCRKRSSRQKNFLSSNNFIVDDVDSKTKRKATTLAEVYHKCTQLPYEDYCDWICQQCYKKLIEFHKFREMCIDSYQALKKSEPVETTDPNAPTEPTATTEPAEPAELIEAEPVLDCLKVEVEGIYNEFVDNLESNEDWDREEEDFEQENIKGESEKDDKFDDVDFDDDNESDTDSDSEDNLVDEKNPPKVKKRNPNASYFVCDVCSTRFFKKHRFEAHKRKHLGLKQWQCEHCDKGFEKYSTMKMHIPMKHYDEAEGKPVHACTVEGCGKSYSFKDSLRLHVEKVHEGKKRKPGPSKMCEQCGKSFRNNTALVKHSYTHSKDTPYKCHICPKMFATGYKLKEHIMRHDGIKNFVCPTCGLRKTTNHELRVHMRYHNTDIQFPCDLCTMVFTRLANMKRHMRIVHCGIKAFPCPHCDRSFGKAETLKHHVMTHTGEKPHVCSICDKRFIQQIALKTHMKTHNKTK